MRPILPAISYVGHVHLFGECLEHTGQTQLLEFLQGGMVQHGVGLRVGEEVLGQGAVAQGGLREGGAGGYRPLIGPAGEMAQAQFIYSGANSTSPFSPSVASSLAFRSLPRLRNSRRCPVTVSISR